MVPVLISVKGAKMYGLLRNLVSPTQVSNRSYDQLVDVLKAHLDPKPVIIAERFHFHRRMQALTKSIAEYQADLKRLAHTCQFGGNLDVALHDCLVCGMNSQSTQKRLLAESHLTFSKALTIALSIKAANNNTQQLKGAEQASTVSYHSSSAVGNAKGKRSSKPKCY